MKGTSEDMRLLAINEELNALDENSVWRVIFLPKDSHLCVACGSEKLYGTYYILPLAAMNVRALHGDVPNAYFGTEKMSKRLHSKLVDLAFKQCKTYMCLYIRDRWK